MQFVTSLRQHFPFNFIFLGLFTGFTSMSLGSLGVIYETGAIFVAVIGACICVSGLSMFAMQRRIEFTPCRGVIYCSFLMVVVYMIPMLSPNLQTEILMSDETITCVCLGTVLFSLFVMFELHMIMGG